MYRWRKLIRRSWTFVFIAVGLASLWLYGVFPAADSPIQLVLEYSAR